MPEAITEANYLADEVELWASDEHRLGLKPVLRRLFAPRGERPVVKVEHRFEWLYLVAFVHPLSGRSVWYLLPVLNAIAFGLVLDNFASSLNIPENKLVLIVLDQAGWHIAKDLVVPPRVRLVFQPSHSPEVQPAEHLWAMVDEAIANKHFETLDEMQTVLDGQCVRLMDETRRGEQRDPLSLVAANELG